MASQRRASVPAESREQRIEAIMAQLRPKIEEEVRKMVERAVDVPEAEEFGAIDWEFRDAGLKLANDVRQASGASRKKGYVGSSVPCEGMAGRSLARTYRRASSGSATTPQAGWSASSASTTQMWPYTKGAPAGPGAGLWCTPACTCLP